MRIGRSILIVFLLTGLNLGLFAFQRRGGGGFYEGPQTSVPPENPNEKAEFGFARLNYSFGGFPGDGYGRSRGRGFSGRWSMDYPKSDYQFVQGVNRLTRLQSRTSSHIVDLESDEVCNWPWMFVEDAAAWNITAQQVRRMREYLLKGGFAMFDDSHGDAEWQAVRYVLQAVFPDRLIEDLNNNDEIFHVLYDLDERFQIHGTRYLGRSYAPDEVPPRWLAIRDDKGRVIVAIAHNSDVGDAWEWADWSAYPEREASLAYRIGINYIVYSMTH